MGFRRLRNLFSSTNSAPQSAPTFSLPDGVRVYAIGDIHGRSNLLATMLHAISDDATANPTRHIIEVFLGDYIDRGMHSREVIDLLLEPPKAGHQRICLRGNHEETMLRFLNDPDVLRDWGNFGGYATLASYGITMPTSMSQEQRIFLRNQLHTLLPAEHKIFLESLPLTYQSGDYLFVHAGILPNVPLSEQTAEQLLWIRGTFLNHSQYFDHYIVHGHSPVSAPQILHHRANIDVSDAPEESLCCLIIEGSSRRVLFVPNGNC